MGLLLVILLVAAGGLAWNLMGPTGESGAQGSDWTFFANDWASSDAVGESDDSGDGGGGDD